MSDFKLIINIDDLGLNLDVNRSFFELLELGAVSSATIMTKRNRRAFDDAVSRALKHANRASFGLHLDLDEYFHFDEIQRYGSDETDIIDNYREIISANTDEICKDIVTQIDTLQETGLNVAHIDGHHFIHQFIEILELLVPIMDDKSIDKMRFNPSFYKTKDTLWRAVDLICKADIKVPEVFTDLSGVDLSGDMPVLNVKQPNNSHTNRCFDFVEVMVHTELSTDTSKWTFKQYQFLKENAHKLRRGGLYNFNHDN